MQRSRLRGWQILSEIHVQAAIFRAVNDSCSGRMKSHNVHSEVVLALNTNNNVRGPVRGPPRDARRLTVDR